MEKPVPYTVKVEIDRPVPVYKEVKFAVTKEVPLPVKEKQYVPVPVQHPPVHQFSHHHGQESHFLPQQTELHLPQHSQPEVQYTQEQPHYQQQAHEQQH